jgi:hypothetical protein
VTPPETVLPASWIPDPSAERVIAPEMVLPPQPLRAPTTTGPVAPWMLSGPLIEPLQIMAALGWVMVTDPEILPPLISRDPPGCTVTEPETVPVMQIACPAATVSEPLWLSLMQLLKATVTWDTALVDVR